MMIIAVWKAEAKPGSGDNFAQIIKEKMLPLMRQHKGFRHLTIGKAAAGNQVIVVSYWNSEEESAVLRNSPEWQEAFAQSQQAFVTTPIREAFEVLLDE
jgi:heme-degrading monooxygenase HmoA